MFEYLNIYDPADKLRLRFQTLYFALALECDLPILESMNRLCAMKPLSIENLSLIQVFLQNELEKNGKVVCCVPSVTDLFVRSLSNQNGTIQVHETRHFLSIRSSFGLTIRMMTLEAGKKYMTLCISKDSADISLIYPSSFADLCFEINNILNSWFQIFRGEITLDENQMKIKI